MEHFVVAVGGQKGGTAKSTVAQGIAVEAARTGGIVIIADLDERQTTSVNWAKRRAASRLQPKVEARVANPQSVWELKDLCNLLVIDAPGYADLNTLELARRSDLLVITTGTNLVELEPTVLLTRGLMEKGIAREKLALALVKVIDADREREAREYLRTANLEALRAVLRWNKSSHDIATDGRAVTEASIRSVAMEATTFFDCIAEAHQRAVGQERGRTVTVASAKRGVER